MRRLLVTGTEGDVGSVLLPQLAKRFDVTGLDIKPHTGPMNALQGDLTRYAEIAAASKGMDAIVHMAALLTSPEQDRSVDINVKATANVLQAALENGVRRVVYCSTVWASGHGHTEPYQPIDEDVPCAPVCMYGTTKWMGELMADFYHRAHGLETVVIRFAGFVRCRGYDADGAIDWDRADIPSLFRRYFTHGFKLMNPVDLGAAFGLAVEKPGIAGERFVVGCYTPFNADDRDALLEDPMAVAERYYPGAGETLGAAGAAVESVPYYFSHEKARARLGFRSRHDLGDLVRLYREWKRG